MLIPSNLFYSKDHEWVEIEGDKAKIGITDFAQTSLGDITFVELPKIGTIVKQSGLCATVESVKAASDVYAPLSGEVLENNSGLTDHPEEVNKSPYEAGWFSIIKITDPKEKEKLMTAAQYKDYVEGLSK